MLFYAMTISIIADGVNEIETRRDIAHIYHHTTDVLELNAKWKSSVQRTSMLRKMQGR